MIDVDRDSVRVISVALALASVALLATEARDQKRKEEELSKKGASFEHRHKKRLQQALGVTGIGVLIIAGFFLNARSVLAKRYAEDPLYPSWRDLPIALLSFAVCTVTRSVLVPVFARLGRRMLSKEKFGPEHEERVQRFAGQLWKVLFHGTMALVPMVILRGEEWWPPGSGSHAAVWTQYPHVPPVRGLREWYLFELGYYFHATLHTLVLQNTRANLLQMTLHHVATIGLVSVSYFLQNSIRFGALVLWLHDVTDVPVCLTRLVLDLSWAVPAIACYVWLMAGWAYFRLWVFPFKTVYNAAYECFAKGWVPREESYGWWLTTPFLLVLCVMHLVWFYELCGMGRVWLGTGKREDSTDAVPSSKQRFDGNTAETPVASD